MSKFKVGDKVRIKFDKSFPVMWVGDLGDYEGSILCLYLNNQGQILSYVGAPDLFELAEEPKEVPQEVKDYKKAWDEVFKQQAQRPYPNPNLQAWYYSPLEGEQSK